MKNVLLFKVNDRRLAFELPYVEQVVWTVALQSASDHSEGFCGLMNLRGNILPVFAMHTILGLPAKPMELTDQLIICKSKNKKGAFWVSRTKEVREYSENELLPTKDILSESHHTNKFIKYVIKDKEELIFVYDVVKLLQDDEA